MKPWHMGVARNTLLKVMLVAMDRCFSLKRVRMVVNNGKFDTTPNHLS